MFQIFNFNSNGNFHHFCAVLRNFYKKDRSRIQDILFQKLSDFRFSPNGGKPKFCKLPLIFRALDYLHYPEVAAELIFLLFWDPPNTSFNGSAKERTTIFESLSKHGFIEKIVSLIKNTETSLHASEFLLSILREGTECSVIHVLLAAFGKNPALICLIVDTIKECTNRKAYDERDACIELLNYLLKYK